MGLFSCFGSSRSKSNKKGQQRRQKSAKPTRKSRRGRKHKLHVKTGTLSANIQSSGEFSPTSYASPRSIFSEEEYHDAFDHLSITSNGSNTSSFDPHHHHYNNNNNRNVNQHVQQNSSTQDSLLDRLTHWWHSIRDDEASTADGHEYDDASNSKGTTAEDGGGSSKLPSIYAWKRTSVDSTVSSATAGGGGAKQSVPIPPGASILTPEDSDTNVGCMKIFSPSNAVHKKFLRLVKPKAGASIKRYQDFEQQDGIEHPAPLQDGALSPQAIGQLVSASSGLPACVWENADATQFQIRSLHYMQTRTKEPSKQGIYELLGADIYSFEFKLNHIAQHVELPTPPVLGAAAQALPPGQKIPPLLIINLQLPTYPPSLFGGNDGKGYSLVYYFGLPMGWEPSMVHNSAALDLLQRFVNNGIELDGQPTRDRLKLLGRVVNIDEWAKEGPLSGAEQRLLRNYNGKPILTRPQQKFYSSPDGSYLEIDLDVHSWAYIARRALQGYLNRLGPVVFENAFVLQGNRQQELPEVVMGAARVYRVDFRKSRPFPVQVLDDEHDQHLDRTVSDGLPGIGALRATV